MALEGFDLSGRRAVVFGANTGIGAAVALAFAEAGADVGIHYNSSDAPARETAAQIAALGRRAPTLRADLSSPEACARLVRDAVSALGTLDLLVHSAANFHRAPLSETTAEIWDDAMNVNARAAMLLAREAAPTLRERRGRIVVFSVLDSIGKGGAQVGVENMNLMFGLDRTAGLQRRGMHPA